MQAILQGLTNFKQCTVLIADAIYWHNLKMKGMDELTENEIENLKGEALHLGDLFIKDNLKYFLLALNCPLGSFHRDFRLNEDSPADDCIQAINYLAKEKNFRVVRWNEWVSSCDWYGQVRSEVAKYFDCNDSLIAALREDAKTFAARRHETDELTTLRSHDYLKDESPAVILIAALKEIQYIMYPGPILSTFVAMADLFINPQDNSLPDYLKIYPRSPFVCKWRKIEFRNYSLTSSCHPDQKVITDQCYVLMGINECQQRLNSLATYVPR